MRKERKVQWSQGGQHSEKRSIPSKLNEQTRVDKIHYHHYLFSEIVIISEISNKLTPVIEGSQEKRKEEKKLPSDYL